MRWSLSVAWANKMLFRAIDAVPANLPALRDMTWLNAQRARVYGTALSIASIAVVASAFWTLQVQHDFPGLPFGAEYSTNWAASRLVLTGLSRDVYVPAVHRLAELPVYTGGGLPFPYPPPYLLLCIPLALLPFFQSLIVFLLATGAALSASMRSILVTPWPALSIAAFPPVAINIIAGQNAFLTAAILGAGLNMLDRRPRLAGAILGLMVIKPHLALAVPITLIISRRWATLLCAAAMALGLLTISYMVFGLQTWAAFLSNAHTQRYILEEGLIGFGKYQSVFALARLFGIGVTSAYLFQVVMGIACVYAFVRFQRRCVNKPVERALIVLACLLMTPYILSYDMVILIIPVAWMLREGMHEGFLPWSKSVLLLVFCIPGCAMLGELLLNQPIPFGLPVMLVFAGWLLRFSSGSELRVHRDECS